MLGYTSLMSSEFFLFRFSLQLIEIHFMSYDCCRMILRVSQKIVCMVFAGTIAG